MKTKIKKINNNKIKDHRVGGLVIHVIYSYIN